MTSPLAIALAVMGLASLSTHDLCGASDVADHQTLSRCVTALAELEGFSATVYTDSRGFPTIGYGHRLSADYVSHAPVDREEAYVMLWADVEKARDGAASVYPDFETLPEKAREALIHMAFQLGARGLAKFVALKKAIQNRQWLKAGVECIHSRWSQQTPKRARFCAALFGAIK